MSKEEISALCSRVPKNLKDRVMERAKREGRSLTDIIVEAFVNYADVGDVVERIEILEKRIDELESKVNK